MEQETTIAANDFSQADPRFRKAVEAEARKFNAITRAIELLNSHPDVDPVERVELMLALNSIDRRNA